MNLFADLNPETPAQREIVDKIQKLADAAATWAIHEGRHDHRQRPDIENDAPQITEIRTLVRQLCKLKEQGL